MSQNQIILKALARGRKLTPYSALKLAGTLRLSERVRELQAMGHKISKRWVTVGRARVMQYSYVRR